MLAEILISAFLIGFAGSLHCVGMCGPLMVSNVLKQHDFKESIFRWIAYHVGRIFVYSMWGLLFGSVGISIKWFGMQQNISLALGIAILAILLLIKKFPAFETKIQGFVPYKLMVKRLYPKSAGSSIYSSFVGGLLNGMLPCGLVYVALAGATAMQDSVQGAIFMVVFGLGTLPMLLFVMIIGARLQFAVRKHLAKWYPIMIGLMAIMLIIRGLNLGNIFSPALMKNNSANIQCATH